MCLDELKSSDKDVIADVTSQLQRFITTTHTGSDTAQLVEMFQLEMAIKFFRSPFLEVSGGKRNTCGDALRVRVTCVRMCVHVHRRTCAGIDAITRRNVSMVSRRSIDSSNWRAIGNAQDEIMCARDSMYNAVGHIACALMSCPSCI